MLKNALKNSLEFCGFFGGAGVFFSLEILDLFLEF